LKQWCWSISPTPRLQANFVGGWLWWIWSWQWRWGWNTDWGWLWMGLTGFGGLDTDKPILLGWSPFFYLSRNLIGRNPSLSLKIFAQQKSDKHRRAVRWVAPWPFFKSSHPSTTFFKLAVVSGGATFFFFLSIRHNYEKLYIILLQYMFSFIFKCALRLYTQITIKYKN
jgi:hypothetical protein